MTHSQATSGTISTFVPSDGQCGIWVQDQLGAADAYNVSFAYQLGRTLEIGALCTALATSIERHEAFRTVFREVDGELVGIVLPDPAPVLLGLERTTVAAVDARLEDLWRAPFDLSVDRLIRVRLLDVGGDHYLLAATVHHIVFDDWSMGLWLAELEEHYRQARAEEVPQQVETDDSAMSAHRQWRTARVSSPAHQMHLDSAVALLDDAPERLDLPRMSQEPGAPREWEGRAVEADLNRSIRRRVRTVARENGCTEYVVYLAAWTTLVSIYAQHDDVVVGMPVADRLGTGADSLVGYFLNSVVVRHRIPSGDAFCDVLRSARDAFYDAIEHVDVSYEKLAQRLAGRRDDPSAPLFVTWFALDDGTSDLALDGVDVERITAPTTAAKFELALFVSLGHGDDARLAVEFASALYEPAQVTSMLRHYIRLLEIVTADPQVRVRDVDVLSEDERALLKQWGRRGATTQTARHIAAEFALAADRGPNDIAIEHADGSVTYRELRAMADGVACRLLEVGVGADEVIGVSVARSPAMVAAVLGILSVGAGYVALDPTYPTSRLQHMVRDSGVRVAVVDAAATSRIAALGVPTIDVDSWVASRATPPRRTLDPRSTAYVTYTSGSTGNPKGIRMSHAAVWNLLAWQDATYASIGRGSRTLQFAALSFDVSAQEIFGTLCSGGILVLVSQFERDAVHDVMAIVRDRRVERVFMAAPALLEAVESAVALDVVPDLLRVLISGSEQLVVTDALRTFVARLSPEARLFNEYGPSETHVATMYEAAADPATWPTWMPVGRPIGDTEVRLLDGSGRLSPPGSVGEICLSGPGLADGYCELPAVTARAFVPDPYSARLGARMYRTGDVARYLPDGVLEFLGRRDTQVKVRGFRIELEEIRSVLDGAADVSQSFVMVAHAGGDSQICAFWLRATPQADGGAVREHLRDRLPAYMVPSRLVEVPAFPLTAHGKVDQRALVAMHLDLGHEDVVQDAAPPGPSADPRTRAIAAAMAKVLRQANVAEHDDFFALGGHSLLANRLVWTLEAQRIASVSLRAVFDGRTPAGIAALAGPVRSAPGQPRGDAHSSAGTVADRLASLFDQIGSVDLDDTADFRP